MVLNYRGLASTLASSVTFGQAPRCLGRSQGSEAKSQALSGPVPVPTLWTPPGCHAGLCLGPQPTAHLSDTVPIPDNNCLIFWPAFAEVTLEG